MNEAYNEKHFERSVRVEKHYVGIFQVILYKTLSL